jgi:predicted nucleotide-binding protein
MPLRSELHRCFHIQIKYKEPKQDHISTDYELDLSEEDTKTFAQQYMKGSVLFKGKWIDVSDIKEIEIRETPEKTTYFFPTIGSSRIFQSSEFPNVTRRFIASPSIGQTSANSKRAIQPLSENIFIIHGRDHAPMKELKTMLYDFGLSPIVLHEEASGGLTLAEKLEKYSKDVGYAFVILTPEDVGGHRDEMKKKLGGETPFLSRPVTVFGGRIVDQLLDLFEPRARQNVIFEMGYFWGLLERKRVCCLLKGNVEKPSDIEGIVYVPFKDSVYDAQVRIMKELKEAGYEIKF